MGLTTYGQLPWPDPTDRVMDGDDKIKQLADTIDASAYGPWTNFTGSMLNVPITAGTSLFKYRKIGRTLEVFFKATLSGVPTGNVQMDLPAGLTSAWNDAFLPLGKASGYDVSIGSVFDNFYVYTLSATRVGFLTNATSAPGGVPVSATAPFTWAAPDIFYGDFRCETTT